MKRLAAAIIMTLSSQVAFAAITGGMLLEWGNAYSRVNQVVGIQEGDIIDTLRFVGYMAGVKDSFSLSLCIPPSIPDKLESAVTIAYLKANPTRLNERASVLVYDALSEAFPCPKQPQVKPNT